MAEVERNATKTISKDLRISPTGSESMLFSLEKRKPSGVEQNSHRKYVCRPLAIFLENRRQ